MSQLIDLIVELTGAVGPEHEEFIREDVHTVDVHFLIVGVDRLKAELRRDEIIEELNKLDKDMMAGGPSYIHVGAVIGDQGLAMRLFALGEVLKLWQVITPKLMGFEGAEADQLAGSGFVMMSGYKQEEPA